MKSLIVSVSLAIIICIYFMSLFDTRANAFYRSFPDWVFMLVIVVLLVGFLLSFYWGITGFFKGQRLFNLLGIGFSLFGLSFYVFGYVMQMGKGKERPGQFDHDLSTIEARQRAALNSLLQQTKTKPGDVQIVAYWGMHKNPGDFVLCIQQGNIIALQVKNKTLADVNNISALKRLNWLVLENCGLKSIEGLQLPLLQRFAVNRNQLTSLAGLENSPQVAWLNFSNNPIVDSMALKQLTNQYLYILNE